MAFSDPTLVFAASGTIAVVGLLCLPMAQGEATLRPLRLSGCANLCLARCAPSPLS